MAKGLKGRRWSKGSFVPVKPRRGKSVGFGSEREKAVRGSCIGKASGACGNGS